MEPMVKHISFHVAGAKLVAEVPSKDLGFSPTYVWCPSPSRTHRTEPYALPKSIRLGTRDSVEAGAKFTPPPCAVVLLDEEKKLLVSVNAGKGSHLWNFCEFNVSNKKLTVTLDLESHSSGRSVCKHVALSLTGATAGEDLQPLLSRGMETAYPAAFRTPAGRIPDWWRRPIYCGYGDQVAISLFLEGSGPEARSLAYCTQGLYERWLARLNEAGLPIGTVIIDAGWSPGGVWEPYPVQWPDLRGFIDHRHKEGRRVLLWIPTWLCEGLPDSWCITLGGKRLTADPTNSSYRRFIREKIGRLLSPGKSGFNADGFKIDQLQYTPTERTPRGGEQFGRSFNITGKHPRLKAYGNTWGGELLYLLQKEIYTAAKNAKPDALVTSSTVHPYFHDTFDMVRLHDTGSVDTDVFAAMKARADLARSVLPHHLIDTDNWVHSDYGQWLDYTRRSHQLGVPCIFYAERFVAGWQKEPLISTIPLSDVRKIAAVWRSLFQ